MIRKMVYLCVVASLVLTTSCKKKDENNNEISEEAKSVPIEVSEKTTALVPVDGKYPVMTFEKKEHDFGMINAGDKVLYSFDFKNTGEKDLIITNAIGSCGCTIPEYPKEAIKPGESGKIKVSFNSAGKHGQQEKTVTIATNTKIGAEALVIKASIKE